MQGYSSFPISIISFFAGMRNPVVIKVQEKEHLRTPTGLTSFYTVQPADTKLDNLVAFLRAHRQSKHLLFFATCDCVNYFSALLENVFKKWKILSLHRKLKHKRQAIFQEFSAVRSGVLVCTDVVARGIDWPDIDWVIQYDIPKSAAVYVHRCGRTARMGGRVGRSLLYLLPNEEPYVDFIKRNQQVIYSCEAHCLRQNFATFRTETQDMYSTSFQKLQYSMMTL